MPLTPDVINAIKTDSKKAYYTATHNLEISPNLKDETIQYWNEVKQASKQFLPADFYKPNLPFDVMSAIDNDSEKALKNAVQNLSKPDLSSDGVEYWSQVKGKAIQNLVSKGKNPQAMLEEKTPVMSFIQNAANVLSIPANYAAQGIVPLINEASKLKIPVPLGEPMKGADTSKPLNLTPPDIWGGSWVDVLGQAAQQTNPEYAKASEKLAYDQDLTPEEADKYAKFSGGILAAGIGLDIGLDPTTYIGNFIGKAKKITELSKLSKAAVVTDVGKSVAKYGMDVFNTLYKASNAYKNLDVIKDVLKVSDTAKAIKALNKIKSLSQGILAKTALTVDDISTIKTIYSDVEKAYKLGKQFKLGGNSVKTMEKFLTSIDAAKANKFLPMYTKIAEASGKIKQGVMKVGKVIIPKPIQAVSNFLGDKLRHLFVSDVAKAYTPAFKAAKNAKGLLGYYGDTIANTIQYGAKGAGGFKGTTKLMKQYKIKEPELMVLLSNIVETGDTAKYAAKYGKLVDELKPMAKFVNDTFTDVIIKELQSGVKTIPIGIGKEKSLLDNYTKLTDEYTKLFRGNPSHPNLFLMENKIKGMIDEGSKIAKINYLPRIATDDAKQFFNMGGNIRPEDVAKGASKGGYGLGSLKGTHSSEIQRLGIFEGMSLDEINQAIKQGLPIKGAEVLKGFAKDVPEFAGKDLFKINIPEIIKARWNKAGYAIQQNVLKEGLLDLVAQSDAAGLKLFYRAGEALPNKNYVNVAKMLGFGEDVLYAPLEVAKEIEKMNKINPVGKFIKTYDKILKALQRVTLIPIPAFHTRNEISNIYALLSAGWNPLDLAKGGKAMKLSAQVLGNAKFSFIDGRGVIHTADNIKELALKNGLMGTDFLTQSLGKGVSASYNPFKAAAQKAGHTGLLGKAPAAYMGFMETGGRWLEEHAKLTLFLDRLLKGDSVVDAANVTKKYLFDYTDLTRFESDVLKRVAFFYTWMRKNIGLQLKNLVDGNPVQKAVFKAATAINKQQPETVIDPRFQSEYMKGTPFMSLGKDKAKNEQKFLGLEGYLPPFNLQQPARILGNLATKGDASELLSMVNPLLKVPIEIGANQNTFTKKPIKKSSGDTDVFMGISVDPYFSYILKQLRPLAMINQLTVSSDVPSALGFAPSGQELSAGQKAQLAFIGKPATINVATQKAINQSLIIKDMGKELDDITSDTWTLLNRYKGKVPTGTMNELYNRIDKLQKMYDQYLQEGKLDAAKSKSLKGKMKYAWKRYWSLMGYFGGDNAKL